MKKKRLKSTDCENLVRQLVVQKTSQGERITNAEICAHIFDEIGVQINDSHIRAIVNDLRNNDIILLLLADQKGHFIAENGKQVREWISTHEKKIKSMKTTLVSINRQFKQKKVYCEYLGTKF